MTPIEEAERAVFNSPVYPKSIMTRWQAKAMAETAIRAFLEAAMRDDSVCLKVASGFAMQAAVASMSFERERDIRVARAAIIALKGTINDPA